MGNGPSTAIRSNASRVRLLSRRCCIQHSFHSDLIDVHTGFLPVAEQSAGGYQLDLGGESRNVCGRDCSGEAGRNDRPVGNRMGPPESGSFTRIRQARRRQNPGKPMSLRDQ
jgi:hypothetical protein